MPCRLGSRRRWRMMRRSRRPHRKRSCVWRSFTWISWGKKVSGYYAATSIMFWSTFCYRERRRHRTRTWVRVRARRKCMCRNIRVVCQDSWSKECVYLFWWAEEKKAEDEAFESDLIAGRLQEDLVWSLLLDTLNDFFFSLLIPCSTFLTSFTLHQLEQRGRLQRLIAEEVRRVPVYSQPHRAECLHVWHVHRLLLSFTLFWHGVPLYRPGVQLIAPDPAEIRLLRGHKLSVTCLVITPDENHIFSASKDCSIIKCKYHTT